MAVNVEKSAGKVIFNGSYNNKAWSENLGYTKVNFGDSVNQQPDPYGGTGTFSLSDAENDLQNVFNGIDSISKGSFVNGKINYTVSITGRP